MAQGLASKTVHLTVNGRPLQLNISATLEPVSARAMLPMFRSLTDGFAQMSEAQIKSSGLSISCRKGCGACCRQLVPISRAEAIELQELIDQMPEPRQSEILQRFENARMHLENSGLLEKLRHIEQMAEAELISLGLAYFSQQIPCPFLEEESCSIHLHRPLSCREFLVVSPAEFCARPWEAKVQRVTLPADVSGAARAIEAGNGQPSPWIPLILALEWAAAHPDEGPRRPGTEWADQLLNTLEKQAARPPGKPT